MRRRSGRQTSALAGLLLAMALGTERAAAESAAADKALAHALFQEGRALLAAGQIADACAKLEESQRLDPSSGTALNLALCHEKQGQLARSWSEFVQAVADAQRDHRQDREAAAHEHLRNLEPRLARIMIIVSEAARIDGLHIELDGRELAPPSWSLAIPVDDVEHTVRATAHAHEPFTTTVSIGSEGETLKVEIPVLTASPKAALALPPREAALPPPLPAKPASPHAAKALAPLQQAQSSRRTWAWSLGAAGVAQLGVAGYLGARAFQMHADNRDQAAGHVADAATVLTLTGLSTAAVGAYLLVASRTPASSGRAESELNLAVVGPSALLSGRF